MAETITLTTHIVATDCGVCGVVFGLSRGYYDARHRDGQGFSCPNGHVISWRETEADRIRKEKDRIERQLANAREDARAAWANAETERRSHSATKGQLTKARKRAAAGVCPCCHRTFQQVARHMASQHPGFDPEAAS